MERIRVGVIGTSWWAEAMHLPSLNSHPRVELAAISGRNRERAASLAAAYRIPAVYADYRAMLERARLDALVVVTPDDLHHEMALAALKGGLHVLCEKPLALTIEQARELAARAESAGVKHMVGFSWRGLPHYRYVQTLLESGYIGRCYAASFAYLTGGGARAKYSWRYDQRRSNGALGNYGAHMIDLARWLLGDIARVSAHLGVCVERPGERGPLAAPANDIATLSVEFGGGAIGTIHASEVVHTGERFHEQHVRLYGEAGTLEIDLSLAGSDLGRSHVAVAAAIRGVRRGETQFQTLPLPAALLGEADPALLFDPFVKQPIGDRLFIDAIAEDRPITPNFHDGVEVQAVMEAAITSHRSRRWVALA
jgi:predicted dehydrogenase